MNNRLAVWSSGAPVRGERVEKYSQLLRIERRMGSTSSYAGLDDHVRRLQGAVP